MKRFSYVAMALMASAIASFVTIRAAGGSGEAQKRGYVIETDSLVATPQSGPHEGGGETTGYSFFSGVPDLEFVFRKRAPSSRCGYWLPRAGQRRGLLCSQRNR